MGPSKLSRCRIQRIRGVECGLGGLDGGLGGFHASPKVAGQCREARESYRKRLDGIQPIASAVRTAEPVAPP